MFPFGDTRYQSNHLIDSNTCINNINFHFNKTAPFFGFLHTGTIRHVKEMWNNIMEKVAGKVLNPIKFIALLNLYYLIYIHIAVYVDCTCKDYINRHGYGNCQTPSKHPSNQPICYVLLPSSCKDLKMSRTNPLMYYSSEACVRRSKYSLVGFSTYAIVLNSSS